MTIDESKLEILKKVETGQLSIEEGADLLAILDGVRPNKPEQSAQPVVNSVDSSADDSKTTAVPAGWKAAWSIILWLGMIFMGLSGFWLYSSYARSGLGWGFWIAFVFLCLSTGIVFFGWRLIAGRWLVLNITSKKVNKTEKVKIWVPFPIHFANWAFSNFGKHMPSKVREKNYQQIIQELDNSLPDGEPFQIDIDEDQWNKEKTVNVNFS